MSDIMRPLPFSQLMDWVLTEYERSGSIFGVKKLYRATGKKQYDIFGEKLELPFGPAAGPHTQLAQNIIAGYAAGGRFFELKTVQVLDGRDLPVSKPCILAADEGYNVEWSTELYAPQALDEYIKGWYALKLLSYELGLGDSSGFVFNMSVGYDLAGIKTQKIDDFIEGLKNAENTPAWQACKEWATDNLRRFKRVNKPYIEGISPEICRSITLSTLHGCPPDEIERIASYLLTEKKLHTFIKCNPTLAGYGYARRTLDSLGFGDAAFDERHFKADLQFEDAAVMLRRLQTLADSLALTAGVKLTNTFPVQITQNELPGEEMYMSGKALFPLSVETARLLSEAFGGKLRISFSGGADARNIEEICGAGIWPITLATTLLKPGGYQRLHQIAEKLDGREYGPFSGVSLEKLRTLASSAASDPMYRKLPGRLAEYKMKARVPLFDCYTAPCRDGCPIRQDIPAYLRLAGEGNYLEALRVITQRNPLPFITGVICSQFCAGKCSRVFYEHSVGIRSVKLEAAEKAYDALMREIQSVPKPGGKIAVIGGGPAGLSAAYFLGRAGRSVTIFEKRENLGGIVRYVIPGFRISDDAIDKDAELVKQMGADIRLNCEIMDLGALRDEGFSVIIVAVGAWKSAALELEKGTALNALDFLEQLKRDPRSVWLGENVAVIGGGNTSMDTARAAKRVKGVKNVSLVSRRTKRYMPAYAEELELALEDGVTLCESLSPISLENNVLICAKMKLGAPDASGRRRPAASGDTLRLPADTVISATGSFTDKALFSRFGIPTDTKGNAVVNPDTLETGLPGVYVIGDAMRGPATIVEAIADAIRCAKAITGMDMERYAGLNVNSDPGPAADKKGVLYQKKDIYCQNEADVPYPSGMCGYYDSGPVHESRRCLECASICELCADVCPNRANITVWLNGRPQIVHIDQMCNECGNCETFCPYSSAPYKDKFTLFTCAEDFEDSENQGFLPLEGGAARIRLDGKTGDFSDGSRLPDGVWPLIQTVMRDYFYLV